MSRLAVIAAVLLTAGCEQATERPPERVRGDDSDVEPVDTGVVDADGRVCGAAADVSGDPVLQSDGCARISPELDQVYPKGGGEDDGDTDVGTDPADDLPWRCGFFNWLGGFSVVEDGDGLALAYCDIDPEGGIRFARTAVGGKTEARTPVGGECLATDAAVALAQTELGWRLFWVRNDDQGRPYGQTVPLDADGFASGEAERLQGSVAALEVVGDRLLVVDEARILSIAPLGADGAPGAAVTVVINVRGFDGAPLGAGIGVLSCDLDSRLGLTRIEGEVVHEDLSSACSGHQPLSLAAAPDGSMAATWSSADGAALLLRDPGGADVLRTQLGLGPASVAWDGAAFVVVGSDGTVRRFGSDGELLGAGLHRPLVGRASAARAVRVVTEADRASVVFVGTEILPVGEHAFAFNFLEISGVSTP